MKIRSYRPGDRVIYRKPKRSTNPGPRARFVTPSRCGEDYTYFVNKFWLVVHASGNQVVVQTRRGKRHVLEASSRNLRRARIWDVVFNRQRFPAAAEAGPVV